MENINLKKIKKIHFIGIGGIGMSAIARMFLLEGKKVSGSDRTSSIITEELEKLGAKINYEQKSENIADDFDLIIYTIAITQDNPELKKAKELKIECLTYPEALGLISADKFTIAVSGTHGKTTTTAMIAKIMIDANLDPTVVVGSLLKNVKSNFIAGKSEYFLAEACEYQRSFLNLRPKITVITNIDNDHLDYYKDMDEIRTAFSQFAELLPEDGFLICDPNDPNLEKSLKSTKAKIIDYTKESKIPNLAVPGIHNVKNAQAAQAAAKILNINKELVINSLLKFDGTWRRFEYKGKTEKGALVYDDYAHHPTEISATIQAAREFMAKNGLNNLIIAFQPHLYSRTKILKDQFVQALRSADKTIIAPIYAAREPLDPEINSSILTDLINKQGGNAVNFEDFEKITERLKEISDKNDLIITMGAGSISSIGEKIIKK